MLRSRPAIAYFLLTLLLLSNMAGWVHVGGCDAEIPHESADCEVVASHCSCDQHADESPNESSEKEPCCPANEHRHDNCVICQNFLAVRGEVELAIAVVVWQPLSIARLHLETGDDRPVDTFFSGHSVRGPPSV